MSFINQGKPARIKSVDGFNPSTDTTKAPHTRVYILALLMLQQRLRLSMLLMVVALLTPLR